MMSPPEEKQVRPPQINDLKDTGNTMNSKILRALESPKSCQSDPDQRIPEQQQRMIEKQKLMAAQSQATTDMNESIFIQE